MRLKVPSHLANRASSPHVAELVVSEEELEAFHEVAEAGSVTAVDVVDSEIAVDVSATQCFNRLVRGGAGGFSRGAPRGRY